MKISLNNIKYYDEHLDCAPNPIASGLDELTKKIGAQLGAIEEVVNIGKKYNDVMVVRVVSCGDHPDADRLHVCKVDDGGKSREVARDDKGYVQIVCGAPNVRIGMLAAWLPPGSTVPSTVDKDPFVLEARTIRGQVSNGMLASPKELALGDSHEGILEITEDVQPGAPFAELANLKDEVIIDIENKMFTHRPDCFGFLGVARELAGIQGQAFKSPGWYKTNPEIPGIESGELKLEVRNELPELVQRFCAITMSGVEIKPSPIWLQALLSSVGLRPINNIVDYSNYFMLLTAQPIHIYDYDKVKELTDGPGARLTVRHAKSGEQITLLNGKTIEPTEGTMMVATDKALACVGGAIGGSNTEVSDETKNIIIEAANWDMYQMRRTAMGHGIFTDAVTRFTKGQSPLQNKAVIARIVDEMRQHAGGKVAGLFIDDNHLPADMLDRNSVHEPVSVTADFINLRLGLNLSNDEMITILQNVEFKVDVEDNYLHVQAPFWRTDIEIPEDIVEEVGRLYGYDHLPLVLPKRDLTPAIKEKLLSIKSLIRDRLANAGANEVLTYSFIHGNLIDKVGQDRSNAYQLSNALSPDLQYFRLSLTPSLLDKVHLNIKAGFDEFVLFEIGKTHIKDQLNNEGLPQEFERLAVVYAADKKAAAEHAGAPYFQAKNYLTHVLEYFNLENKVSFVPINIGDTDQSAAYYEPGRSATITFGEMVIGRIGEYKASVRQALKLPDFCAGFELGISALLSEGEPTEKYELLPRFPRVTQDITLRVNVNLNYAELHKFIEETLAQSEGKKTKSSISVLDIFQRPDDKEYKNVTFRLTIHSFERTLTDSEVAAILDKIAQSAQDKFGATKI